MAAIRVACPKCGAHGGVAAEMLGKKVRCNKCGERFEVKPADEGAGGREQQPTQPAGSPGPSRAKRCPRCEASMDRGAVICVECGFDFRTGEQRRTQLYENGAPVYPKHRKPEEAAGSQHGLVMLCGIVGGILTVVYQVLSWRGPGDFAADVALNAFDAAAGAAFGCLVGWAIERYLSRSKIACVKCDSRRVKQEKKNFWTGKWQPNRCRDCGYEWEWD